MTSEKARTLLRRLRDLNLSTGPIAVRAGLNARLAGCSSLDAPAESGVRYRLRTNDAREQTRTSNARAQTPSGDAREQTMELTWTANGLELALTDPIWSAASQASTSRSASSAVASATVAKLQVNVTCDTQGRACIPAIGARVSPSSTDEHELEHFLRRVVRTLVA
jgi:hypothetical protein